MSYSKRHTASGFTIIEVIVAIGLLAILASTMFIGISSQMLISNNPRESYEALSLAREGLEASRAIRDMNWSSLTTGTHGLLLSGGAWSFQNTSDTTAGYARTVTVSDTATTYERKVVSTVRWTGTDDHAHSVTLSTNVSNWRNAASYTPVLTGNWTNPQTLSSFDLGPGNVATGMFINSRLLYMTGTASASSKPDFFVINVTTPSTPSLAASLDTGTGLNAVAVSGTFAYAANTDVTKQLQILNVSATSSPYLIKEFRLTGNNSQAVSIAATGTLVYVGTKTDSGTELYSIDVSNPSAPSIKATLEVGGDVNRIKIVGNRAFLATSSSTKELMVVNISNPNALTLSTSIDLSGTNAALGLYVNTQDSRAYISRAVSTAASTPEVYVYDVSSPDAPSLLGSMEYTYDIPAIFAADAFMFLGTSNSSLEFQTYNASTPSNLTYYSGLNFPQDARDIVFDNNTIYTAVRSNDALRIITSQ